MQQEVDLMIKENFEVFQTLSSDLFNNGSTKPLFHIKVHKIITFNPYFNSNST